MNSEDREIESKTLRSQIAQDQKKDPVILMLGYKSTKNGIQDDKEFQGDENKDMLQIIKQDFDKVSLKTISSADEFKI